jgi:hypothetical protein
VIRTLTTVRLVVDNHQHIHHKIVAPQSPTLIGTKPAFASVKARSGRHCGRNPAPALNTRTPRGVARNAWETLKAATWRRSLMAPLLSAQTRATASRGRMLETSREQVSALPAVGTGRHSGRLLHWIAVSLSKVKRTTAKLPLRWWERQRRRDPPAVLVLVKERLRRVPALCVASRREGAVLPGHRNRLTPRPCRSDTGRRSAPTRDR